MVTQTHSQIAYTQLYYYIKAHNINLSKWGITKEEINNFKKEGFNLFFHGEGFIILESISHEFFLLIYNNNFRNVQFFSSILILREFESNFLFQIKKLSKFSIKNKVDIFQLFNTFKNSLFISNLKEEALFKLEDSGAIVYLDSSFYNFPDSCIYRQSCLNYHNCCQCNNNMKGLNVIHQYLIKKFQYSEEV